MQYKKSCLQSNLSTIQKKDWYLQRFDAAPFFITLISIGELIKEKRKMVGGENSSHVSWFFDNTTDWLIEQDDINRISELVFRESFNLQKITNKIIISKLEDMKNKKQLTKLDFKTLQNTDWYHQQGDGCLFTWDMIMSPYTTKEKRRGGMNYNKIILYFCNDVGHWYHDYDDLESITGKMTKKADKKNDISKSLMSLWKNDEKKFFTNCKRLDKVDLSKLTDKQLRKEFVSFVDSYINSITSSSIIDGFALGTDEIIQKEIATFLKSKDLEKMEHKYFTALTAPVTQSFINMSEVSLLEVADLIFKNKKFKNVLLKNVDEALLSLNKFPIIKKALLKHVKDYFWTKNNYVDCYVLTEKDFLREMKSMILGTETEKGINFKKEIKRIKNTPIDNKKEKSEIIKKIKLSQYIKNLLTISEDFTYWQDERKKRVFLMTYYGFRFLREIGQRHNYSLEELEYFIYPEVVALLDSKKIITREEIKRRRQSCLFYQKHDKYEILSGAEAEKYKKEIFDKKQETNINDFRGMPASRGRVRGRVKILMSVKEMNKIEKGDILVAVMTRPDYIPAIKKASAIITDEGGVTCHAAIVSRELGIPCVIGTKIATKVLKDGDEVEVNANHGVVNIIKRV